MISNQQQIKHTMLYVLPVMVGNVIPLLILPIFTRILTKEDYGALALAQVYASFMCGLANFGMMIGYQRNFFECSKDVKKSAELLYSTLSFILVTATLCVIITYIFKYPFARWIIGSSSYSSLLFIALCATLMSNINSYIMSYYRNMEIARSYVAFSIGEYIGYAIGAFVFIVIVRAGVIGIVLGQFLGSLMLFFILGFKITQRMPLAFNFTVLKSALKISLPMTPSIFFKIIGTQFDKFVIGLMGSIGGVGIYSIGQKIAYTVFAYMTAIENVFLPQVYQRMFDLGNKGSESIGKYLTPFIYISVAVALLLVLFSEEVMILLTPPSYHDAINIVIILTLLFALCFFGKIPQLIYAKKTFTASLMTMLRIIINVIIDIPLIMKWGAIGAASGALISEMLFQIIYFFISQHYYYIKWEYAKITMIYAVLFSSALAVIILRISDVNYLFRFMIKACFILMYVVIGLNYGIISKKNIQMVAKAIPSFKTVQPVQE